MLYNHSLRSSPGYTVLLTLFGLAASLAIAYLLVYSQTPIIMVTVVCLGLAIIAFVKPEYGLFVLVIGMMLSPEIILAKDPKHDLIIRIEDIFIIIVFIAWFTHCAINKQLKDIIHFPLNAPILIYVSVCIISTLLAVLRGDIIPLRGFFFVLKYIEYFVLFFVAVNVIKKPAHINLYLMTGFVVCIIVTANVYIAFSSSSNPFSFRATGPFEGQGLTEPASLGGYYLIVLSLLLGFAISTPSTVVRIMTLILYASIIVPFILTQSRASYLAFIPMTAIILILSKNWKVIIIGLLCAGGFILLVMFSEFGNIIKQRVMYTFITSPDTIIETRFEPSAQTRIESWQVAFTQWLPQHPLFGWGVTGVGLVDAQFPRVIGETGLLGLFSFLWILISLWRRVQKIYTTATAPIARALSLGFLAGFIGIVIQSLTTNTFIIIRIMEPFWFVAALVILVPKLYTEHTHAVQ